MMRASLEVGRVYRNRNDRDYLCKAVDEFGTAVMERVSDGWTLRAHGVCMYPDGTIEWDYSGGGHWPVVRK